MFDGIEPVNLNFGKIVNSTSIQKELTVKNLTGCHISVKIEVWLIS